MTAPIRVFFSYAHKDEALRSDLTDHLSLLQSQGLIEPWTDREISAGTDWEGQISENLEKADLILLLVSASFLASKYCRDSELKRALERHEAEQARVVPIIVRPADWQSAPFGKLQALPREGKAVTSWSNQDEAWTDVAKGLRKVAVELAAARPKGSSLQTRGGHAVVGQAAVSKGSNAGEETADGLIDFAILTALEVERRAVCAAFGLGDGDRVRKGSRVYWRGRLSLDQATPGRAL